MAVTENPRAPGALPRTGAEPSPPAGFTRYRFLQPCYIQGIGLIPAGDVRELSGFLTGANLWWLLNDATGQPA